MKEIAYPNSDLKTLPVKQRIFVLEYLKDFDGKQAAIRAGYSARSASTRAHLFLHRGRLKEHLEIAIDERLKNIGVNRKRVLEEIARLSFSDNRKLYNDNGSLKLPKDWDDDTAAAVAGAETFEEFSGKGEDRKAIGHTKKVKVWDKPRALEMLAKHLKLITERHEVDVKGNLVIERRIIGESPVDKSELKPVDK